MSSEETPRSRQENEFLALTSIFGADLKDLRARPAWKNLWTPLDLSVTLKPQRGGSGPVEIHVQVDLHVICSESYPNSVPKILIENGRGLSDKLKIELQMELEKVAHLHKGEEMIFNLCQHVEGFLYSHNIPGPKSFFEEMQKTHKLNKEKQEEAMRIEQAKQMKKSFEELKARQEMQRAEAKLRRRNNSVNIDQGDNKINSSFEEDIESQCGHKTSCIIDFQQREIVRGQCLKHTNNHVVYSGVDNKSGEMVSLSEWIFDKKKNTALDLNLVTRNLSSIDQEINHLIKLRHQNIARYLAMKYVRLDDVINVYVTREFINGSNCNLFRTENFSVNIQFVKHVSAEVLKALDYLHKSCVTHKDLKQSCVYVTDNGGVVLSNYSIHKRLSDLTTGSNSGNKPEPDIVQFGHFVKSLLLLSDDQDVIPRSLPTDLQDLLAKCLQRYDKERPTASQLLNHSFYSKSITQCLPKQKIEEVVPERNISPDVVKNALSLMNSGSESRLMKEFEFSAYIGTGAFGNVTKMRNNLDGNYYAIKRIKLNPKNHQLNKKIVREVKLLSRLNHENVVRYYNSWIEVEVHKGDEDRCSTAEPSETPENIPKVMRKDEFTVNDNIEELAPPIEYSVTYDSKSQRGLGALSDDSSDGEESWLGYNNQTESDDIVFKDNSASVCTAHLVVKASNKGAGGDAAAEAPTDPKQDVTLQKEYLYIQMEFCENSTLKNAIDSNLYMDETRMWRLFREIVEGLAHIHQQGMIHRDLKPMNIFLDFEDHVKIGDFGLATTSIRYHEITSIENLATVIDSTTDKGHQSYKTGKVGTELYVAPELNTGYKAVYNQKVDIYSLGIIFFEMCYKPLNTQMERYAILSSLRSKDIIIPEDLTEDKKTLLRMLLSHDETQRPTAQQLLESSLIPPPVLEVRQLCEMVRNTLSDPKRKAYKYMIASCFDQTFTPAEDITYDKDPSVPTTTKLLRVYDFVKQTTLKIFKQHGGQNLSTPLLMPKSKYLEGVESGVKLMTRFGGIVTLPHDLRVPFARYVAWNDITFLRRYSIERVYREKKVYGFMPRELYECAFDIVTPSPGHFETDAELLYMVYKIFKELPIIKNKQCVIRLNHKQLIKAILLHFGIKEKHSELCHLHMEYKNGRAPEDQLHSFLVDAGLSDPLITSLKNILGAEFEVNKAANHLQMIIKKRSGEAGALARQALQELRVIASNAEAFGVTFEMKISPGTVYNMHHYSGMICQFTCELKKKNRHGNDEVLAMGGRYDSMIASYRKTLQDVGIISRDVHQSAVGISISMDRLVHAIQREQSDLPKMEFLDVIVCSVGSKSMLRDKMKIIRSLWSLGIRGIMVEANNNQEIEECCAELKVTHLIMLKESEQGTVYFRSWEKDRFHESQLKISDAIENMPKIIKSWNDSPQDASPLPTSISRLESRTEKGEHYQDVIVNISVASEDKLASHHKKRHENSMWSVLDGLFKKLKGHVSVFGLTIESNVLRTIATHLEFGSEEQYHKSTESIIANHPRHKKYLAETLDVIYEEKTKKTNPFIIIYSLPDSTYKLII